jgi:hypothetical protein
MVQAKDRVQVHRDGLVISLERAERPSGANLELTGAYVA